jgi:Outer membrane protein beta-barrel domain
MKKSILLICLISLFKTASAQFSLGIKGGVSTSKVITDAGSFKANFTESLSNKTGFVFGVYANIGKKFYFQPEVLLASKGGKVDFTPTLGGSPVSLNIKTTNLDVPLLIGYKFFGKLKVHAGPVASIKLSEDESFVTELRKVTGDVDAAFQKATFGYQAGIGIKLLGFNFDLRKDGSLSDISATKFGDSNTFDQRITGWQITIGKNIL